MVYQEYKTIKENQKVKNEEDLTKGQQYQELEEAANVNANANTATVDNKAATGENDKPAP